MHIREFIFTFTQVRVERRELKQVLVRFLVEYPAFTTQQPQFVSQILQVERTLMGNGKIRRKAEIRMLILHGFILSTYTIIYVNRKNPIF